MSEKVALIGTPNWIRIQLKRDTGDLALRAHPLKRLCGFADQLCMRRIAVGIVALALLGADWTHGPEQVTFCGWWDRISQEEKRDWSVHGWAAEDYTSSAIACMVARSETFISELNYACSDAFDPETASDHVIADLIFDCMD